MRRAATGFVVRLAIATAISVGAWLLMVMPFDRPLLPLGMVTAIFRVIDFPVAVAGLLLYPIRGIEVLFGAGDWCDFCSPAYFGWLQMRIAIPTYLFLLYLPSLPQPERRTWKRLAIALPTFAMLLWMELVLGGRADEPRLIAKWLLVFTAAATVAWSSASPRVKIACSIAVWLAGSWALANLMPFIDPKTDSTWAYAPIYLVHVLVVVGGALWVTRVIEVSRDSRSANRDSREPTAA